jgi:uncharacterized protein YciI
MYFIIRFKDKPDIQAERRSFADAHAQWIASNRSWILMAGSLRFDIGQDPLGGLWMVDLASKEEAEQKISGDPYWPLRATIEIHFWKLEFSDMQMTQPATTKEETNV